MYTARENDLEVLTEVHYPYMQDNERLVLAVARLEKQQEQVEVWGEESIEARLSLEDTAVKLDKALEREQGLKSSLASLQRQLDTHAHLIIIPTFPLVSLSFSACLATPAVAPLVAAKPCQVATASAYCTHKPCLHIMSPPQHRSHPPMSRISQLHHLRYSNGLCNVSA